MRTPHIAIVLGLALAASACGASAVGPGASGYHPPAPRPGMVIQEWDHYCVYPGRDFEKVLAEAGAAGFEMAGVAATNNLLVVCFKRPVMLAPAPTAAPSTVAPAPGA